MNLMETFSDPTTFEGLSTSEKLLGGTVTLAIGMGITFCILILLWFIIVMMSKIVRSFENREAVATAEAGMGANISAGGNSAQMAALNKSAAASQSEGSLGIEEKIPEDEELLAVITAAILAAEGDNPATSKLVVRKIKRTNDAQVPWARAGIEDCANSRREIN